MDRLDATEIGAMAFVVAKFILTNRESIEKVEQAFPMEPAQLLATILESGLEVSLGAVEMFEDYGGEQE